MDCGGWHDQWTHKLYAGIEPAYRIECIRSLSSVEKHVTLSLSCSVNSMLFAMAQRVMVEIFYRGVVARIYENAILSHLVAKSSLECDSHAISHAISHANANRMRNACEGPSTKT